MLRDDFPDRDDKKWLKHTLSWLIGKDTKLDDRPVHLFTLSDEVAPIPPKPRVY